MKAAPIALHDPALWPVRMTVHEIAAVLRISRRSLYDRIARGRFPHSDDGRSWDRDVVERYVKGGIKAFEKQAARCERRQTLSIAGGRGR